MLKILVTIELCRRLFMKFTVLGFPKILMVAKIGTSFAKGLHICKSFKVVKFYKFRLGISPDCLKHEFFLGISPWGFLSFRYFPWGILVHSIFGKIHREFPKRIK